MKKILLFYPAILCMGLLRAQPSPTPEQQVVQQTVVKFFDALSDRDSISLKIYCTPDITLYEYVQVWNRDTLIMKAVSQNRSAGFNRTNSFDFLSTQTDKNMAWVNYYLHSSITRDGKQSTIQWLETVVLVKQRKQWKLRHLHSTLIKRS